MCSAPTMVGTIDRRILLNVRVDPEVMAGRLPPPFRPQTVGGWAMAGICLIRMTDLRPAGTPRRLGLRTENAAHRVAVEWADGDRRGTGVYIPRRDTSSRLATLVGGRMFPGRHHRARFDVRESARRFEIRMRTGEPDADLSVVVTRAERLPPSSIFTDLEEASAFYRSGSLGYSATGSARSFDGLELDTPTWRVEPLAIESFRSGFFDSFPAGTVHADHALVMTRIDCAWRPRPILRSAEGHHELGRAQPLAVVKASA